LVISTNIRQQKKHFKITLPGVGAKKNFKKEKEDKVASNKKPRNY
jgi:hypothetical protein